MSQAVHPGLRGVKPKSEKCRLKAFIYGEAGSGKSFFCTQFPKPYYIDTEKGAKLSKYAQNIEGNGGVTFETRSFDDLYKEIKQLATVNHDFQTLVIDSITPIYTNLVDKYLVKSETERTQNKKQKIGSHYDDANRDFKRLCNLLLSIDMNVIVTAHAKDKYGSSMSIIGTTFDAYKKFNHIFDEVYEAVVINGKHTGICRKTRLKSLKASDQFDFSYQEFSKIYEEELKFFVPKPIESKENNIVQLERKEVRQIENRAKEVLKDGDIKLLDPISKETLQILLDIISKTKEITPETVQKWRDHFSIKDFSELREFQAQRLLLNISQKFSTLYTKP